MKANLLHCQLIGLIILALVPWPGPTVFKIRCPKDSAAVVRRLIQNKWVPVLEKYQVTLPLDCPFNPTRDIFFPQESAKRQYRPSQWTCGFCGKSFYQEKYLDLHFSSRHRNKINMAEDAVCLSDYCDIMRCEVLQKQNEKDSNCNAPEESPLLLYRGKNGPITDLEVWREPTQKNALSIVPETSKSTSTSKTQDISKNNNNLCDKSEAPVKKGDEQQNNHSNNACDTFVDSVIPPRQRYVELQKLKANCKSEDLSKLKFKCEVIRKCAYNVLQYQ